MNMNAASQTFTGSAATMQAAIDEVYKGIADEQNRVGPGIGTRVKHTNAFQANTGTFYFVMTVEWISCEESPPIQEDYMKAKRKPLSKKAIAVLEQRGVIKPLTTTEIVRRMMKRFDTEARRTWEHLNRW